MNQIMLDLETMGKGPNAAIVAIGAVVFDTELGSVGDEESGSFYRLVTLESAVRYRLQMDPDTVMWWLRQGEAARAALTGHMGMELHLALDQFSLWVELMANTEHVLVWGNGAAFDNVILRNAYREVGLQPPWSHWNDRCYRTVKAMRPEMKVERHGVHHNAVHDAISQARHLMKVLESIEGGA